MGPGPLDSFGLGLSPRSRKAMGPQAQLDQSEGSGAPEDLRSPPCFLCKGTARNQAGTSKRQLGVKSEGPWDDQDPLGVLQGLDPLDARQPVQGSVEDLLREP